MSFDQRLRFDSEKAVEIILYLAGKLPQPGVFHVCKMFYFADRKHLDEFGQFICDDRYVAMKNGPVPSRIYDILKDVRDNRPNNDHAKASFAFVGANVVAKRQPMLDLLSESELECLDWAIETYGAVPFKSLSNLSHDDVWQSADENDLIAVETLFRHTSDPDATFEYWKSTRTSVA